MQNVSVNNIRYNVAPSILEGASRYKFRQFRGFVQAYWIKQEMTTGLFDYYVL